MDVSSLTDFQGVATGCQHTERQQLVIPSWSTLHIAAPYSTPASRDPGFASGLPRGAHPGLRQVPPELEEAQLTSVTDIPLTAGTASDQIGQTGKGHHSPRNPNTFASVSGAGSL